MTNPQQPYLFGFPSNITAISFPGRPRILTVEVAGGPCPPGNYGANGEPFVLSSPIGNGVLTSSTPNDPTQSFKSFKKPPSTAPVIATPFSKDMLARYYGWEEPIPIYLASDQSLAGGVLFLDIDNIMTNLNNPKSFQFQISTRSHVIPSPLPPAVAWFLYYDPLNLDTANAAVVNATQDINTQSFLDITINQSTGQYYVQDRTAAANPFAVADYGTTPGSICSMYSWFAPVIGYTTSFYPNGFATEAEALAWMNAYINGGSPDPAYPGLPGNAAPGAIGIFPWAYSPAPGPPGFCSWQFTVKTWRRATQFTVTSSGTVGDAFIVGQKNKLFPVGPIQTATAFSNGANSPACVNTISVVPASMRFSVLQKFS